MKYTILLCLMWGWICHASDHPKPICLSQPVHINEEGHDFRGTENLLMVPENRNDPNSRLIALHFFHFPAKEKSTLAPVAFLGAGPGEPYAVKHFYESYQGPRAKAWTWELNFVNQKRDLLLINQRGNPESPGLPIPEFAYRWQNGSLDEPLSIEGRNERRKEAFAKQLAAFAEQGVDARGYDILHFVDDIDAIRTYFGYEKMAFFGNSFGSQWGLAYIRRYPEHVDRAVFSGVEPLDHGYDDPQGVWQVLEQIDAYARKDSTLAADLPEVSLTEAYKTIIQRLEAEPVKVHIVVEDEACDHILPLGPDDLRKAYMNPFAWGRVEAIESWPKYITELYDGDYRTLALRSRGRDSRSGGLIMASLVDNSLGISAKREAKLNQREAQKWLGDINLRFKATRSVSPAAEVSDDFRRMPELDIPILLIHGDMDRSTPYTNALELMESFPNGHLITVERGTHTAKRALILGDSTLAAQVYEFMNVDFEQSTMEDFRTQLPDRFALPTFNFWPIKGETLFDKYMAED
ncbi:MAG: alpha/beta fold hydrolase [Bacteroidota bacterium]